VREAERWIVHLASVGSPLAGVVFADYAIVKRGRLDVDALYDPAGRYRYRGGVNVPAVVAIAVGIAVYYAVPHSWVKAAWGAAVGAVVYLALERVAARAPEAAAEAAGD